VKRNLAARRTWGLGVIWVAGHEPEPAPVQVTVVHVIHHYLPLPTESGEQACQLPQQRGAIAAPDRGS
jgi:hypothetical protein